MAHGKLAEIVVDFIEFLELVDDDTLDPDLAVDLQESIAAHLNEAKAEERAAVQAAAKAKLDWLLQDPDEYGYTPRKTVPQAQVALLQSIVSGEAYGWPPGGAT